MKTMTWSVPVLALAAACWGTTLAAQEEEGGHGALAKAVIGAPVSLNRGLAASASHGQPISAKFEMEEGKLQLSVYTVKDGKFFEVIVDHNTGRVRSEEHTSELQSPDHLVCRLLLEKKNITESNSNFWS